MSDTSDPGARAFLAARRVFPRCAEEMTWWHRQVLKLFMIDAYDTQKIAWTLNTTEADAYNLLAQAREAARRG